MTIVIQTEWEWATPILLANVERASAINKQLVDVILEKEAEMEEEIRSRTTLSPWNRFSQLHRSQRLWDWPDPAVASLKQDVSEAVDKYLSYVPGRRERDSYQIHGWANIHRTGDWHGMHTHLSSEGEIAVGVYWVSIPERRAEVQAEFDGELILYDPRGFSCPWRHKRIIQPQAGSLIVHPAWLAHEVAPNRSSSPRISIAFDVTRSG